jgi:hypothetical protein
MHPMQDLFSKVFHMHGKLICNLYALLCWQNFILANSGCYTQQAGIQIHLRDSSRYFVRINRIPVALP